MRRSARRTATTEPHARSRRNSARRRFVTFGSRSLPGRPREADILRLWCVGRTPPGSDGVATDASLFDRLLMKLDARRM